MKEKEMYMLINHRKKGMFVWLRGKYYKVYLERTSNNNLEPELV